jgi:hypothetical protein
MRLNRVVSGLVSAGLLAASLVACGGGDSNPTVTVTRVMQVVDDGSSQQCLAQMPDATEAHFASDLAQDPNAAQITQAASNVPQVCMLDAQGNQHYYHKGEGLDDKQFFEYALMFSALSGGHGFNSLLTAGVLSGNVSAFDALILSSLVGVDRRGNVYHPYTIYNGSWTRHSDYNVYVGASMRRVTTVTTVYTGRTKMSYAAFYANPPQAYKPARLTKADPTVGYNYGANGTVTKLGSAQVSQVKGQQLKGTYGYGSKFGPAPTPSNYSASTTRRDSYTVPVNKPSTSFKASTGTTKTTTKPRR